MIQFLNDVLALFNGTLNAIMGNAVLAFFMAALVSLVIYALLTYIARLGQRGKL